ncbi:hypothetical protein GCM10017674_00570 [Streptomyces gardneri]|uniref:Uncharacterized protein n=1 Tax=Streptomyces gardneri TaxID=66892 RepID=A0A4Y3RTX1_9ACTN|nr:hypothetical protein SGA01_49650 [Streptomyces gardneri]GHG80582.1 hypothetical protein GCM10017674_00570 [Streptomyces gardneri]
MSPSICFLKVSMESALYLTAAARIPDAIPPNEASMPALLPRVNNRARPTKSRSPL